MNTSLRRGLALVAGLSLVGTLAACSPAAESADAGAAPAGSAEGFAKDENTLVMGMVPDQQSVESNFQPLVDYISAKTGKEVELVQSTDYAALVEASIAGRIDIGNFSGFTYVAATNGGAPLTPIGVTVTSEGAEPGYESLTVVPAGSDITKIADLKGKKVCFVDPGSTSGYLYPSAELLSAGLDPESDVTPVFAGGHDASAQKTAQGVECDAGFAEDAVVETTGIADGLFAEGDLTVINRVTVPGAPLVMSTNLPKDVQESLKDSLQNITIDQIAAEGIEVTDSFRAFFTEIVPVEDSYYDSVRKVCEETGAAQCKP
ncbi:Phosphonate ABC transporter phosphate-binding periplasmic component (TC 3.A.1.9.1) [Leucobacter sp. 7(1)]|uniref:phosphate/phosphite/phosphonate ABC transporter substrate-binding protein n=1 Tax=Leucobacter sp. 7(1) TaxID=1255613 RepID=UPI00097F33B8|nr:phosphate/phosphite/phosphonate ABC transporter substrate-binding protein [Leucobacter sp. 7(1)]SJN12761.1 Phosphonate ABC transporter phosphate-binding periplasmic component (TC 3.A.1.9.1) [Leucobacter sp. 7(1)]